MDFDTASWIDRVGLVKSQIKKITVAAAGAVAVVIPPGYRVTVRVTPASGATGAIGATVAEDADIAAMSASDFVDSGEGSITAATIVALAYGDITHIALTAAADSVTYVVGIVQA